MRYFLECTSTPAKVFMRVILYRKGNTRIDMYFYLQDLLINRVHYKGGFSVDKSVTSQITPDLYLHGSVDLFSVFFMQGTFLQLMLLAVNSEKWGI